MPRHRTAIVCDTGNPPTSNDLITLGMTARALGWCNQPVEVETPLPPWDRRAVVLRIAAPTEREHRNVR